ncbi:MAG: aldo/keto reductase [Melioribacteraceae bacterium]|nr:aldo/keto reductase [Melioribacteraceae bacterium]
MKKKNNISRRNFMRKSALGVALVSSPSIMAGCLEKEKETTGKMPMRVFGNTGLKVSLLSFGGGSHFLRNNDGEWQPMLERAVEMGVNLFDTSPDYKRKGLPSSEERFGEILSPHRNKIHIITKFNERSYDAVYKELEGSLKGLRTDYIDFLFLHALKPKDDLDEIEKGPYKAMLKLKEEGVVKHIGFSDMNTAVKGKEMIERFDMDVVLIPTNPTTYGGFVETMMPSARKKNMGIMAMKLFKDVFDKGGVTAKELVEYATTLNGISTVLVSHHGMDKLETNFKLVQEIENASKIGLNRTELETRVAHLSTPKVLEWARPEYIDGSA